MPGKQQLLPLTGLRFLLALWVVIFHENRLLGSLPSFVLPFFQTGYLAVSFFFVLSGFVLAYNYQLVNRWTTSESVRFGIARIARIYPAYFLGFVTMAPVIIFGAHQASRKSKGFTALLSLTLTQSWIPQAALSWNSPGWSLSNEAFFYLCFPLIGLVLWRPSRILSIATAATVLWVATIVVPLIAVAVPINNFGNVSGTYLVNDSFWPNLIKFNPILRLPDFCTGILLARTYTLCQQSYLRGRGYYLYLPALSALALAVAHSGHIPYPVLHNSVLLPLYASVILGLAFGGGPLAWLLARRELVFLGKSSYSLYILHVPLAAWFFAIATRLLRHEVTGLGIVALYSFLAVLVSAFVFHFVEEPAHRLLRMALPALIQEPAKFLAALRSTHGRRWRISSLGARELKSESTHSGQTPTAIARSGRPRSAAIDG